MIIENHSNLDFTTAKNLANKLKIFNIKYFKEATTPFSKVNKHLSKYLSEHIDIPIAHGERIYTRWGYAPYFEDRSIDMIQIDIGNTGGLTEAKRNIKQINGYIEVPDEHGIGNEISDYCFENGKVVTIE